HLVRQLRREDGRGALAFVEGLRQGEAAAVLSVEHTDAGVLAGRGVCWLRAHEYRRHDDLVADDQAVDDQVMSVDLPAPGLGRGRRAKDADPVRPLAELDVAAG